MSINLETDRLQIREIILTDAVDMYELNSDPEVMRYTGDVHFNSLEETKQFIQDYPDYKKNGFGRNAIVLKETGQFLGWCGLKKLEDRTVDIGYRFMKRFWNKGYATESAKAIIDFGFKNYDIINIIGNADEANIGSIRVFEKLGMTFVQKRAYDGIENAVLYTLEKKDWK